MADENLSWGSLGPFMGTDGPTHRAAACVSRAACAWVAVPMYRMKYISEDAMCVLEAQRPHRRRVPLPVAGGAVQRLHACAGVFVWEWLP
jgi:hypothetical protein